MRFTSSRLRGLTAVVAVTLGLAGCGSSTPSSGSGTYSPAPASASGMFPATITAANGTVHIPARPRAIVSLDPTATEMLYSIGAGSQVKAVDSLSDYPSQAPKTKLSAFQPNVEAIARYRPDLVVISNNINGLEKKLAALSIPVLYLPALASLAGEYREFGQLGQATGHQAQASQEAAAVRRQIAQVVASVPKRSQPASYYYELDQTYYSVTSDTFVGSLLSLLGLKSIADAAKGAAKSGGYPQLSSEYIVRADPSYIILADTVCCHQSAATVTARPGWSSISAVTGHHVIALNDDIASRWGPRVVDLLRTVASGLGQAKG